MKWLAWTPEATSTESRTLALTHVPRTAIDKHRTRAEVSTKRTDAER